MHERANKQYIFRFYDTFAFNHMRFDENLFICQCEKEDKVVRVSNFSLLLVVFE